LSSPAQPLSIAQRNYVILILMFAAFCSLVAMRITDPLLPAVANEFGMQAGSASRVISSFAIVYGIVLFFYGPLAERYGKLFVIGAGLVLSAIANIGVALSSSFENIVVWRGISGGATAGIIPLAMAWIGETVDYKERQPILARFLMGVMVGTIAAQVIGGIAADSGYWRIGFYLVAIFYMACWVMLFRSGAARSQHKDSADTYSNATTMEHFGNVLSKPWPRIVIGIAGLEGVIFYGALVFVPTFLHLQLSISLTFAGFIMTAFAIGGLLYASNAGYLVRQLGETGLVRIGGGVIGIAFIGLIFATTWWLAVITMFMAGFGLYMLHNTLQTQATQMTPESRGTAVTLFSCSIFLGQFVGVSGAGWMFDNFSMTSAFWVTVITMPLIGLVLGELLKHPRQQAETRHNR
jgi:MFS transporter, YNFM family, putative membrane transport protein